MKPCQGCPDAIIAWDTLQARAGRAICARLAGRPAKLVNDRTSLFSSLQLQFSISGPNAEDENWWVIEDILRLELREEKSKVMRPFWMYSMAWIQVKVKPDQLKIFQHFKRLKEQCKSMTGMTSFPLRHFDQKRPLNQIKNVQSPQSRLPYEID